MARLAGIDLELFPLNLGGNPFGWTCDQEASFAVLDAFVEAGGNFVDTADLYSLWVPGNSGGESEAIIGAWLAARGGRDRVAIATKTGAPELGTGLGRRAVETALERSLERLGTDYVDLYYAHFDDPDTPITAQVETFGALLASGRIRAIGLSNYGPQRLREWCETARRLGVAGPTAIQPEYHLLARKTYEREIAPVAQEYGVAVLPYLALASGFLTGKYRCAADVADRARGHAAQHYLDAGGLTVVDALAQIASSRGEQIATVALAWLLAKGAAAPIASVSRPEQLPALMACADLTLASDEVAALDEASTPFA